MTGGQPEYAKVVKKADRWMLRWHHRRHGEWGYRDVPRLLFIEEKLALGGGDLPTDIKVHAFSTRSEPYLGGRQAEWPLADL